MNKLYHVVHFLDDGSTYAVPEWWLERKESGIFSFWPPYPDRLKVAALIKRKESPCQARGWSKHPVKVLHSYNTLEHALENISAAELTSNLESDASVRDERITQAKRPRRCPDYDSESSEEVPNSTNRAAGLPTFPVTAQSTAAEDEPRVYHQLESPAHLDKAVPQMHAPHHSAAPFQCHLGVGLQPGSQMPTQSHPAAPLQGHLGVRAQSAHWNSHSPAGYPFEGHLPHLQPDASVDHFAQLVQMMQAQEKRHAAFREILLTTLTDLKSQVMDVKRQLRCAAGVGQAVSLPEDCPVLPVRSAIEIRDLNAYLDDKEKRDILVAHFSERGGNDNRDAARKILARLIDNQFAKECSWKGSGGEKVPLVQMKNVLSVVFGAVVVNFKDGTTEHLIEDVTKKWINSSCDRNGGRNDRRKK